MIGVRPRILVVEDSSADVRLLREAVHEHGACAVHVLPVARDLVRLRVDVCQVGSHADAGRRGGEAVADPRHDDDLGAVQANVHVAGHDRGGEVARLQTVFVAVERREVVYRALQRRKDRQRLGGLRVRADEEGACRVDGVADVGICVCLVLVLGVWEEGWRCVLETGRRSGGGGVTASSTRRRDKRRSGQTCNRPYSGS